MTASFAPPEADVSESLEDQVARSLLGLLSEKGRVERPNIYGCLRIVWRPRIARRSSRSPRSEPPVSRRRTSPALLRAYTRLAWTVPAPLRPIAKAAIRRNVAGALSLLRAESGA